MACISRLGPVVAGVVEVVEVVVEAAAAETLVNAVPLGTERTSCGQCYKMIGSVVYFQTKKPNLGKFWRALE
jgi:hypothetical protein